MHWTVNPSPVSHVKGKSCTFSTCKWEDAITAVQHVLQACVYTKRMQSTFYKGSQDYRSACPSCALAAFQLQTSISPEALSVSPVQNWLLQPKQSLTAKAKSYRVHVTFSGIIFRVHNPLVSATESMY